MTRTARQAKQRLGPRPLPLHLGIAAAATANSLAALSGLKNGLPPWSAASGEAARLRSALTEAEPSALDSAVRAASAARFDRFLAGVTAYRRHPFRRGPPAAKTIWQSGTVRLLDYGVGQARAAVLLIPSLVNRYYVMDLLPQRSFAAFLKQAGIRPLMIDWGGLDGEERDFDLTDIVTRRLVPALRRAAAAAGQTPLSVLGYCMGGNLALALALHEPEPIAGLALLATPWDFHAERADRAQALAAFAAACMPAIEIYGAMPVDLLQWLFVWLDPLLAFRKMRHFATLDAGSDEAVAFVALEDWLNDGAELPAPIARECFAGWYGENAPARGAWRIGNRVVAPSDVTMPSLLALPTNDRIVPPRSAAALAAQLQSPTVHRTSAGHIGMMTGRKAESEVWQPVARWLAARQFRP